MLERFKIKDPVNNYPDSYNRISYGRELKQG